MDVLRENIGLLQLPQDEYYNEDEDNINEGFLGFGKKKSRWQRFKDAIKRPNGRNTKKSNHSPLNKLIAGAALLGAGYYGHKSHSNYKKLRDKKLQNLKFEKDELNNWHRMNPDGTVDNIETIWLPHKLYNNDSDTIFSRRRTQSNQQYLDRSHDSIDSKDGWI